MIVGNIEGKSVDTEFIRLDLREFVEYELDISKIYSVEELLEQIDSLDLKENGLYKIILIGNRNFEINLYKLLKIIENKNIIKIKDQTKIAENLEQIANDSTLKGIFVKEMLKKLNDDETNKEIVEKAIEIGLNSL